MDLRIGVGHDSHRLEPGTGIVLGGVTIDCEFHAVGHSDADVLLHAVIDSLLGAAGLGDIGEWFPDTDAKWAGADSSELLKHVLGEIRQRNWGIANVDCTVFAERPKLSPHKDRIRSHLAQLLGIAPDAVNIKAKTGEKVGPIGRGEAIAAEAAVLLRRDTP